jgi:hypothetical protein
MAEERMKRRISMIMASLSLCGVSEAQFVDDFADRTLAIDSTARNGWSFFTGDGSATMMLDPGDGYASIRVDASGDRRNIWWALIKRDVSARLDLARLNEPGHELRIAARIRVSHAPRRVNLHLNTQKTVDFHSHLMEFDIPDAERWHAISMTTRGFEAEPGDRVFGQLALMDWGLGQYRVDIDEFRVDVVDAAAVGPDEGTPVPYHPPIPPPETFALSVGVAHDATIDAQYPEMSFNDWSAVDEVEDDNGDNTGRTTLLSVSGTQLVILRWNLGSFVGKHAADHGLLELTTHSLQRSAEKVRDFGMIRVVEILGGAPDWAQESVTYDSFRAGQPIDEALNT